MRIITVTHAYPRWDGDFAGAFVERLAVALSRRSHEVSVVAPADQGRGGGTESFGVDILRVRYGPASRETLAYRGTMVNQVRSPRGLALTVALIIAQARAIRKLARAHPSAIGHAHWWIPSGLAVWLARILGGPPYVVTLHGTDVAILSRSRAARMLARRVLRGAAAVTAVSTYLARKAAEVVGLDRNAILVQPMPLDVDRFTRTSAGGGGVVTVARLSEQKRISVLLEAVSLLKTRGKDLPLTVVGDGPHRGKLEQRARELGIDEVTRFLGQIAPAQVPQAIGDADVFAFPAVGEGFGLAAAEALMLGVPVVYTETGGGVSDIVPKTKAGRIVRAGDAGQMAQAIEELASDPDSRRLAAEHGKNLKEQLAPDTVAARFDDLFRRLMAHA